MGRRPAESDYGLPPLTFDEAARVLGTTRGELMAWVMERMAPSPQRWSEWTGGKRPLPERLIRLYLVWAGKPLADVRRAPIARKELRPTPTNSDHQKVCQEPDRASAQVVAPPAATEFLDEHYLNDRALEALGRLPESERPIFQTRLRAITPDDILRLVTRDTIPVPGDASRPRKALGR
jgi:hypothetical protein